MNHYSLSVNILYSLDEFESHSAHWNDLWERSTNTNPTARSQAISLLCKTKASGKQLYTVVVKNEEKDQWVAALPLVEEYRRKVIRCAVSPRLISACLLVERGEKASEAMKLLIHEVQHRIPAHWICAESVRLESFEWNLFLKTLQENQLPHYSQKTHDTALISLNGEMQELIKSWDKGKMKEIKRHLRKISESGKVELVEITSKKEILEKLPICFAIENQGWKGKGAKGGMSIIKRGQVPYFTQNAALLADCQKMFLFGLVLNGQWIAYQYVFGAKNTVYSNKISYLPEYRKYSPGFLLRQLILEYLNENRKEFIVFDCVGEYMDHQSHWNPTLDPVGYIVFPTSKKIGDLFFKLYRAMVFS